MSSLIGLLLAVLGTLLVLPTALQKQSDATETTTLITTAQQQQALLSAAQLWVQQNLSTVQTTATASTPMVIPVATLATANVGLPSTFNALNPYGQTWQVEALQPTAGTLQILVMATGGQAMSDYQVAKVAQNVGQPGGFIPQNDSGVYPLGAARAYGNQANWNIATTGYSGVSGGHPAALLVVANGQVQNNALYRVAVPGQPQLNQMQTAIDANMNNINNANTVSAQKIVTPAGNSVQVGNTYYYGDGANSAVRQNGALYVQHLDGSAADVNAANMWAGGAVTAGWLHSTGSAQIDGSTVSNGRITSGEYVQANGYGPVGGWCSNAGQIGQDGSQTTLCKNNQWVAAGGSLAQSNCGWIAIPNGGNGGYGMQTQACPVGWYVAGYGNYREGDWKSTGEAQIYCCSAT